MKRMFLMAAAALGLSLAAHADEAGHREADAHVHGHGVLNIAGEGDRLLIELEVPGADILGFEHVAESEDEKRAEGEAREQLQAPLALFVLPPGAGCTVAEHHVSLGPEPEGEEAGHDGAGHDHEEAGHSEVHATYELTCTDAAAIDSIRFAYFERFPRAEVLQVNIVTARGQNTFEVTREAPVISLRGMM